MSAPSPSEAARLRLLLENTGNNLSPRGRRRVRFSRRQVLWNVSRMQSVRHCGRVPRSGSDGVSLRLREGVAGYGGLQHCGSVWACPVCAGRILVHRALEIGAVLGRAIEQGHPVGFVTLTMRHHRAQPLRVLWGAAQKAWQRAISGKGWVEVGDLLDGWVRVWEVTHGQNGWHVHVHCVVVLARDSTRDDLERIGSGMFQRWSRGLTAAGLEAPKLVGQDWHLVEGNRAAEAVGDYLAKMADSVEDRGTALGLELTHSQPGRTAVALRTRPHWGVLDEFVTTGDVDALALWHEWERHSKGKRQVGWSKGLRERFAPEVEERTDAEVVAEELGTAEDDLVRWTRLQWREFVRRPALLVELLDLAELGGASAVRQALDQWGVAYRDARPAAAAVATEEDQAWPFGTS